MNTLALCSPADVLDALATVTDPELDEPITELGFVRSVMLDDDGVVVHLR
ncbi:MAG: iron-sulfur cluster assembly protein, partial [Rhodococcus sp. (in: high G+C Gram-positive bacteria)]